MLKNPDFFLLRQNYPPQEIIREEASLAMVYSVQETEVNQKLPPKI